MQIFGAYMADGQVNAKLVLKTEGLDEAEKKARGIHKALEAAKQLASKGFRSQTGMQPNDLTEYGSARAAVGTGAGARDFAQQAQGLGGLVRVYATFAANLFAVGAAFTALSTAADTTNMIKGLDQLGSSSGRNLGQLAKRLVEVTDGAISMATAVESVAKSSAAGLSDSQILKIGDVALKASQALGVDMVDATNRLTRGIAKLEPELLDELGIFTKIGPATENYARSIGKSALALTDFERRQAFANAVLAEGAQKFGELDLAANPYNKLLASVKNLTFAGLELANKVLAPIASILANSPTTLGLGLAAIVGLLVKQAIPAITSFRESLQKGAEDSLRMATQKNIAALTAAKIQIDNQAEDHLNRLMATENRIKALAKEGNLSKASSKQLNAIVSVANPADVTDKQLKFLDRQSANVRINKELRDSYAELAKNIRAYSAEEERYKNIASETPKFLSQRYVLEKQLTSAIQEATSKRIASQAAENAATLGTFEAFKQLRQDVAKTKGSFMVDVGTGVFEKDKNGNDVEKTVKKTVDGMGALQRATTLASGAFSIATNAISGMLSVVAPWAAAIGIAVAAFAALSSFLSKNAKEAEKTSAAIKGLDDAIDNVGLTLDKINKRPLFQQLTVQAIEARANALRGLAESMSETRAALEKEVQTRGWFDSFTNFLAGAINKDTETVVATKLAVGLVNSLKLLEASNGAKEQGVGAIREYLGLNGDINFDNVKEAIDKLGAGSPSVQGLVSRLSDLSTQASVSAARGKELSAAWEESSKTLQDFIKSSIPSDGLSKLGSAMTADALKLTQALEDPIQGLNAIIDIAKNSQAVRLLPPSTINDLANASVQAENLRNQLTLYEEDARKAEAAISSLTNKISIVATPGPTGLINLQELGKLQKEIEKQRTIKINAEVEIKNVNSSVLAVTEQFKKVAREQFAYGAELISSRTAVEFVKAGATVTAGLAGLIGDTKAGVLMRAKAEQAGLAIQAENIKQQINLFLALEKNTIQLGMQTEYLKLNNAKSFAEAEAITKNIDKLKETFIKISQSPQSIISGAGRPAELIKRFKDGDANVNEGDIKFAQQLQGLLAQLQQVGAQQTVNSLKTTLELVNKDFENAQKKLDLESKARAEKEKSLSIEKSAAFQTTVSMLQAEKEVKLLEVQAELEKEGLDRAKRITALLLTQKNVRANSPEGRLIQEEISKEVSGSQASVAAAEAKAANINKQTDLDITTLKNDALTKQTEYLSRLYALELELQQVRSTSSMEELEALNKLGLLTGITYDAKRAALEQESLLLDRNAKLAALDAEARKISASATGSRDKASSITDEGKRKQQIELINREEQKQLEIINKQRTSINATFDSKKKVLDITNKLSKQEAIYSDIGESLSVLFGDLGTSVLDVVKAFGKLKTINEEYGKRSIDIANQRTAAEERYEEARSDEDIKESAAALARIRKEETELAKNRTAAELDANLQILASSKKLFSEKTAAYKALSVIETTMHVMRIAQYAEQAIAAAASVGKIVAAEIAKQGAFGITAIVRALADNPFPASIAIAAGIAALVASLTGKKSNVQAAGYSSEDRQKVQGTGSTFNSQGKIVETGGGVFGDSEAKTQSIANSLVSIKDTNLKGLQFNNKMVELLEDISEGINGSAKILYSVGGLRSGSAFGTTEGTSTSGINGLFGKNTTKEISDAGIKFNGSFRDVMQGIVGSIQQYEDVLTTTRRSGFLGIGASTSTSINREIATVGKDVVDQFSFIFKNVGDLLVEAGGRLGESSESILAKLGNVSLASVEASLRGLKGEDLEKELNAVISNILDNAATTLFGDFSVFRKFGEGMAETILRIVDTDEKVEKLLDSIGNNITGFASLIPRASIEITQALVTASGGLEEFIAKSNKFAEDFLTEAERLAPKQRAVVAEMERLGLSSIDTKDEFKLLVQSLDLTKAENIELFNSLMNVSEAFAEVYESTSKTIDVEEARSKLLDMEISLQRALGNVSKSVQLEREEELAQLAKYPAAEANRLILATKSIRAIEDMLEARKLETELIKLTGKDYEALIRDREDQLYSMTEEQRVIQRLIFAREDYNNTQELALQLMEEEGKLTEVTRIRRQRELDALSATDAAIQLRIFALQDEKDFTRKKVDAEIKMYELLGDSAKVLAITRRRELDAADDATKMLLEYQYALEDESTLRQKLIESRDKEVESISSTIDSIKDSVKALKEYRSALLNSEKSVLTPMEKYEMAKKEATDLAAIALSTATTEAEKAKQKEALDKLPAATDSWLEASRTLFASSEAYTNDFNSVLSILDNTTGVLDQQASEFERQLDELKKSTSFLDEITNNTKTTNELLAEYLELVDTRKQLGGSLDFATAPTSRLFAGTTDPGMYQSLQNQIDNVVAKITDKYEPIQPTIPDSLLTDRVISLPALDTTGIKQSLESLNAQVAALRQEQADQTSQMISTNVAATAEAARELTEAQKVQEQVTKWLMENGPAVA